MDLQKAMTVPFFAQKTVERSKIVGPKIYGVFCVGFGVVIIVIAKRSYTPFKMVVSFWIFLLHGSIFRGELLVSGRVVSCFVFFLDGSC